MSNINASCPRPYKTLKCAGFFGFGRALIGEIRPPVAQRLIRVKISRGGFDLGLQDYIALIRISESSDAHENACLGGGGGVSLCIPQLCRSPDGRRTITSFWRDGNLFDVAKAQAVSLWATSLGC